MPPWNTVRRESLVPLWRLSLENTFAGHFVCGADDYYLEKVRGQRPSANGYAVNGSKQLCVYGIVTLVVKRSEKYLDHNIRILVMARVEETKMAKGFL